jgi:hypothetical protein
MRLPKYRQTLLTVGCLGILGLFAGCYQVSVSFEPDATEVTSTSSVAIPENSPAMTTSAKPKLLTYQAPRVKETGISGALRMSNQTNQPVRLALLSRQRETKSKGKDSVVPDGIPAHWDFAPQEGNEKGLVLSLPKSSLKLEKGDILVVFAQDGSRRYWGPYIVGETPFPAWNSSNKEWLLILNP